MIKQQAQVEEFHRAIGAPVGVAPCMIDVEARKRLIQEEVVEELFKAMEDGDFVEAVDAVADSIYVLLGTLVAWGVDLEPIFDEVHKTNMAKVQGGWFDEHGKFHKPPGWTPPKIAELLNRQILRLTTGG